MSTEFVPLKVSKANLAIPLSLSLFLFLHKQNIYCAIALAVVLFMVIYFILKRKLYFFERVTLLSEKYFLYIFYAQALIFGFLHLTNYMLDIHYIYLFPLFTVSYVVTGCFFGYLRVKYTYGIFLCIVSHIVINSVYCFILSR